jgi:hypothetical protein
VLYRGMVQPEARNCGCVLLSNRIAADSLLEAVREIVSLLEAEMKAVTAGASLERSILLSSWRGLKGTKSSRRICFTLRNTAA